MTAPIIASESEALDAVHDLIRQISPASKAHAGNGGLASVFPAISASGLLGVTVPPEHQGADISNIALGEIVLCAAVADRQAAAVLASHFHSVELLRHSPASNGASYFYNRALSGDIFLMIGEIECDSHFSALSLVPETGRPGWRLNGSVETPMDVIHAEWIIIRVRDDSGEHAAFIPRMTTGLRLTAEHASFSNLHIDAESFVALAPPSSSTAGPLDSLLQSAQRLGWAERKLNESIARHHRTPLQKHPANPDYLSALGLTVSRIESGKAALERAGQKIDLAQVNTDEGTLRTATFSAAIALSSAAEAFDLACEIGTEHQPACYTVDPYGHAPIGARMLENAHH